MNVLIYETCATKSEKVPGTAFLDDRGVGEENIDSNLKKAAGKNIILSPQPSDQPDDPLNWSKKIKTLYFIGILLTSVGPAIMGPLLVPAFNELSSIFDVPLTTVAQLNGGLVMSLGVSSYLCNQLSLIHI